MKEIKYNFWFALIYEILNDFSEHYPKLKKYKIVKLILNYCKHDWILWKIDITLKDVDIQAEKIKKEWEKQEEPKEIFIEHPPDGSKAQELLGGAMEIKGNFKRE